MFDKRLFRELKIIKLYWFKVTAAIFAAVTLTISQAVLFSDLVNGIFINKKLVEDMLTDVFILVLIITLRTLLGWWKEYYNRLVGVKIKRELRSRLIDSFVRQGPVRLKGEKPGRLVSLSQDGIEALDSYFSEFIPQLVLATMIVPFILLVTFYQDWISGLIMLFTAPLIPIFMILIGKIAGAANKKQWKALQLMSGHFLDVIRGLSTLRIFAKSKRQGEIVQEVSENYRKNTMEVLKLAFLSALVLELIATLSTAMISVSLGIRLLYGRINFRTAFFILLLTPEYYQPMRQLGAKFHSVIGSISVVDDIYSRFERESLAKTVFTLEKPFTNIHISIKDLSFSYEEGEEVVNKLSMEIPSGSRVSLVGPSGSGKSTIVALIMGFIDGYSGSLSVNGMELSKISKEEWYENFAYVSQNPKIFKASVLKNITMARPDSTLEEVMEISKATGIDTFIKEMPKEYDTLIGEGGINISGGQAQLLAITRACLKRSEFVILDEPTSALDPETESKINLALSTLLRGKTVLTIAHRIPTIINSDKIYVIEKGKIVEEGNHEELMNLAGNYQKLLTVWEEKL